MLNCSAPTLPGDLLLLAVKKMYPCFSLPPSHRWATDTEDKKMQTETRIHFLHLENFNPFLLSDRRGELSNMGSLKLTSPGLLQTRDCSPAPDLQTSDGNTQLAMGKGHFLILGGCTACICLAMWWGKGWFTALRYSRMGSLDFSRTNELLHTLLGSWSLQQVT